MSDGPESSASPLLPTTSASASVSVSTSAIPSFARRHLAAHAAHRLATHSTPGSAAPLSRLLASAGNGCQYISAPARLDPFCLRNSPSLSFCRCLDCANMFYTDDSSKALDADDDKDNISPVRDHDKQPWSHSAAKASTSTGALTWTEDLSYHPPSSLPNKSSTTCTSYPPSASRFSLISTGKSPGTPSIDDDHDTLNLPHGQGAGVAKVPVRRWGLSYRQRMLGFTLWYVQPLSI